MEPPRVVVDTNVLISGLCFGGKPAEVLKCALAGKLRMFTSAALLGEFRGVMEAKFPARRTAILDTLRELSDIWEIVPDDALPQVRQVSADPADDRVLECALAAQADCIVSGDRHLVDLGAFGNIPILKPGDFLRRYDLG